MGYGENKRGYCEDIWFSKADPHVIMLAVVINVNLAWLYMLKCNWTSFYLALYKYITAYNLTPTFSILIKNHLYFEYPSHSARWKYFIFSFRIMFTSFHQLENTTYPWFNNSTMELCSEANVKYFWSISDQAIMNWGIIRDWEKLCYLPS